MKVLIVLDNLGMGGIGRSLLNLLPPLAEKAQCDVLLFDPDGAQLPDGVKLLESDKRLRILGMSQRGIMKYSPLMGLKRAGLVLVSRILDGDHARRLLFRGLPRLEGYDLAISFSQDVGHRTISTGCNQFVLEQVDARRKAAFIHCDYEHFGGYHPKQEAVYARFDRVVCVSRGCRSSFLRKFPALEQTTVVCENFTDTQYIQSKLEEGAVVYGKGMNIVTVCRLGAEKGLLRAAKAMRRLVQTGQTAFLWTVVGDGPERSALERYIHENGLDERIRLVGSTLNPYMYMKNADVFLLPSVHEAAPMVFGECQALGLPILTTETASARELVEQRQLGTVCENSSKGIEGALRKLVCGQKPERLPEAVISQLNVQAQVQLEGFLNSLD